MPTCDEAYLVTFADPPASFGRDAKLGFTGRSSRMGFAWDWPDVLGVREGSADTCGYQCGEGATSSWQSTSTKVRLDYIDVLCARVKSEAYLQPQQS